jgi:2-polyprenyl-3-methyl-5-hydroxy-6-metoxy-1,4-benzoquinol methylase
MILFWLALEPFMFIKERWEGTPDEVDLLRELVELSPRAAICDVGCGPGRFSLEFARRGFQVTVIDRTLPYLESGRKRAADEGLAVEFVQADMRSYVRPNALDCAISMYTTFGYFEDAADNRLVLENILCSLKEDGKLVIEMIGKEILARIFLHRSWDQVGDAYLLQE